MSKRRMLLVTGANVMVNTDLDALTHLIADEWDTEHYQPGMLDQVPDFDAVMLSLTSGVSSTELAQIMRAAKPGRVFVKQVDIQYGSSLDQAFRTVPVTAIATLHPSIEGTPADAELRKRWMGQLHPDSRLVYSEFLAGLVHTIGPDIEAAAARAKAKPAPDPAVRAFYWGIRRKGVVQSLKALGFGKDPRDAVFGTVAAQFRSVRDVSRGLTRDEKFAMDSWAYYAAHAERVLLPYEPIKSEYQITRRLLECAHLAGERTVTDPRLSEHVMRFLDPAEWVTYAKQVSGELTEILDEGLATPVTIAAKHGLDLGPELADDRPKMLGTLRHVLDLKPRGTAVEFGVGSGRSLRMIAEQMPVVGFDSFRGLPERWRDGFEAGMFACPPPMVDNATLAVGLFEDTLPLVRFPDDVGLWHLDADLESSTRTILAHIGPRLRVGAYVVFDEIHGWPGWQHGGEHVAWREFVEATGIEYEVIGHGPEQWAIRVTRAPRA